MFAFVVYAVGIWYAAARWRRRWQSFAWVAAGLFGCVFVAWLHTRLNIYTHGKIYLPILRSLLYPYTGLVVVVGLYIACLPRGNRFHGCCPWCKYDLAGLPRPAKCPECGRVTVAEVRPASSAPADWFNAVEVKPSWEGQRLVNRAAGATPARPAAPPPAIPPWPGVAEPAACVRKEDQ